MSAYLSGNIGFPNEAWTTFAGIRIADNEIGIQKVYLARQSDAV